MNVSTLTLKPRTLLEFAQWQEEHNAEMRAEAERIERDHPGWLAEMRAKLDDIEAAEAKDKRQQPKEERSAPKQNRPANWAPEPEFPEDHEVCCGPYSGYGRHSPSGRCHISWGTSQWNYVLISHNDLLALWFEPSACVVDAWIADNGFFVVKAHTSDDDVSFAFADDAGEVFYVWTRPWRFLSFLRFDTDGMGFKYDDDTGTHEVRFENEPV